MESQRFEKLMEYFKNEDNNIDFMVNSNELFIIQMHKYEITINRNIIAFKYDELTFI